jgi:Heparan-alpha-glucosaminide N-acetyltransferase, catalytic
VSISARDADRDLGSMGTPAAPRDRFLFLDGLRGFALACMVLNHTARWWMDGRMTWPRYHLIYVSMTFAAPAFLFLVGFCMPLAVRRQGGAAEQPSLAGLARKFVRRGLMIVLAGMLLNVMVFPTEPFWSWGVLQTIGLSLIALVPALWLLCWYPATAGLLLGVAAALYVGFSLSFGRLADWVAAHPLMAQLWFYEFPPWPWVSLPLVGLVLGWWWLDARARSPAAERRYLAACSVAGGALLIAFFVLDWLMATPLRFGLKRDFILNRHWAPRGLTLLWIFGTLLLLLSAHYYIMEVRAHRLSWLVVLGQTALFLYFVHQVIALSLVNQRLGWRFNRWDLFVLANAVLIGGLVGLGRLWIALKRLARRPQARPGAPSTA